MFTALLMLFAVFVYLIFAVGALALELASVVIFLLWPILLPVAVGWKIVSFIIWLIILLILGSN